MKSIHEQDVNRGRKMTKKKIAAGILLISFIIGALGVLYIGNDENRVPVLIYHHISNIEEELSPITITPEKFYEDMLYLKAMGYNTVNFQDLIDYREGKKTLPENPIIVTFDDGYMSNYTYAYTVLKELKMKGVISIIGSLIDESSHSSYNFMLTWDKIREMSHSGVIEIQSHSYDLHNWGDEISSPRGVDQMKREDDTHYMARFKSDTKLIMDKVKEHTGKDITMYTYPYGIYNDKTEKMLKDLGIRGSLTGKRGVSTIKNGLFSLRRINMVGGVRSPILMRKIIITQLKLKGIPFYNVESSKERIKKLEELLGI
jgi:peptidoglycan/xylan/chitin deacetylase (PgdA/CDA1 family)